MHTLLVMAMVHKTFKTSGHSSFFQSLVSALHGMWLMVKSGANFRRQLLALVAVLLLAVLLRLSVHDIALIILVSASVLAFEALNSALELLEDVVHPHHHPVIRHSKDIAAGAVVIMSTAAIVIGLFLFVPRFYELFLR